MSRHDYRPFFTLLHLMDPHWPYEAPAGFDDERGECSDCDDLPRLQYEVVDTEVRAEVERRYRAEVAFTDHEIGRLYDELDKHHLLERTWIIVTSDHGEEFWDHGGFLHGHTLYDELLRVPLVLIPPRGSRMPSVRVVDHQVRLEDIAPTVLEIALGEGVSDQKRVLADGSPATLRFDGRSLLEFVVGENDEAPDSEPRTALLGFVQAQSSLRYGVRGNNYKLIDQGKGKFRRLYDLIRDPDETRNIAAQNPDTVRLLMRAPREMGLDPLENPSRIDTAAPAQTLDADLAEELRSLGYLD
jgi:arylsulfatase A-like enzyme